MKAKEILGGMSKVGTKATEDEAASAIGRLFMAVSVVQLNVITALGILNEETEQNTFKALGRKFLKPLIDELRTKLSESQPSPLRDHVLEELTWLLEEGNPLLKLRNDIAHGAFYKHNNSGEWSVGRPWSEGKGLTDKRTAIDPNEIDRHWRRSWNLAESLARLVLVPSGAFKWAEPSATPAASAWFATATPKKIASEAIRKPGRRSPF